MKGAHPLLRIVAEERMRMVAGRLAPSATCVQLRQDASRHRYRYKPPDTPDGFWDMGFKDSLVSRVSLLRLKASIVFFTASCASMLNSQHHYLHDHQKLSFFTVLCWTKDMAQSAHQFQSCVALPQDSRVQPQDNVEDVEDKEFDSREHPKLKP
jgi:hypothetical protein